MNIKLLAFVIGFLLICGIVVYAVGTPKITDLQFLRIKFYFASQYNLTNADKMEIEREIFLYKAGILK